mgnify:CR=1 FL=1
MSVLNFGIFKRKIKMENHEQRIVIKFFYLKGLGYKKTHQELEEVLHESAISLSTVKRWIQRFKSGDLTCQDLERSGRPQIDLSESILAILNDFPFASAKYISKRLYCSTNTIISNLENNLGYKRFIRRWVPHELTEENKIERVQKSKELLAILLEHQKNNFCTIITLDESWFYFEYQARAMYASSSKKVPPRTSHNMSSKKCMLTIAFSGDRLYCIDSLPKGTKFNQEYFIDNVLSKIVKTIKTNKKKSPMKKFHVHMDNSKVHNGFKSVDFLNEARLKRTPHPAYSPDISPCDFWLFARCKNLLEEKVILNDEQLINEIQNIFDTLTFEELQSVFNEWIRRLEWVIENNGEYINE